MLAFLSFIVVLSYIVIVSFIVVLSYIVVVNVLVSELILKHSIGYKNRILCMISLKILGLVYIVELKK